MVVCLKDINHKEADQPREWLNQHWAEILAFIGRLLCPCFIPESPAELERKLHDVEAHLKMSCRGWKLTDRTIITSVLAELHTTTPDNIRKLLAKAKRLATPRR